MENAKETLNGEASGDNDDTNASLQTDDLRKTLKSLKMNLLDSEREIAALRERLTLEKCHNREFVLQYHEKCMKSNELLKEELQEWKEAIGERINSQMMKNQLEERKRMSEEIAKISELYSSEIAKALRRKSKEWHLEYARKTVETINKEKLRQIEELENFMEKMKIRQSGDLENHRERLKRICGKLNKRTDEMDKKNRKCYSVLRKHVENWEVRLKDDILKSYEGIWKRHRNQVKEWFDGSDDFSWKKENDEPPPRGDWRTNENEPMRKTFDLRTSEEEKAEKNDLTRGWSEGGFKDLRKMEEGLKSEMKMHRGDLARKMDEKVGEIWMAFETFKHNFILNSEYQSKFNVKKSRCDLETSDDDECTSSDNVEGERFYNDDRTPTIVNLSTATDTDETNEALINSHSKRRFKPLTFGRRSTVEMPIVPQIRDDKAKKKL